MLGRMELISRHTQVRIEILDNSNRYTVRNVKGPVRNGDIMVLLQPEQEASRRPINIASNCFLVTVPEMSCKTY